MPCLVSLLAGEAWGAETWRWTQVTVASILRPNSSTLQNKFGLKERFLDVLTTSGCRVLAREMQVLDHGGSSVLVLSLGAGCSHPRWSCTSGSPAPLDALLPFQRHRQEVGGGAWSALQGGRPPVTVSLIRSGTRPHSGPESEEGPGASPYRSVPPFCLVWLKHAAVEGVGSHQDQDQIRPPQEIRDPGWNAPDPVPVFTPISHTEEL